MGASWVFLSVKSLTGLTPTILNQEGQKLDALVTINAGMAYQIILMIFLSTVL